MGNCLKKELLIEDSMKLIDHNYDLVRITENHTETINHINKNLKTLNSSSNENFELINHDIRVLKNSILELQKENVELKNHLSNHQFSSKYGGISPVKEHASVDGPLITMDSTSVNSNALL
jgi:hypothetical protein